MAKKVAPHAGAWIETNVVILAQSHLPSHPMRVRGLKRLRSIRHSERQDVAPHAGAWIETNGLCCSTFPTPSHPMRVRGLKLRNGEHLGVKDSRTPCGCVD